MSAILSEDGSYILSEDGSHILSEELTSYLLQAEYGSCQLTGNTATTLPGYRIGAEYGQYSLYGRDISVHSSFAITCQSDEYQLTGKAVSTVATFIITSDSGDYVITGDEVRIAFSDCVWFYDKNKDATWTERPDPTTVYTDPQLATSSWNTSDKTFPKLLLESGDFLLAEDGTKILATIDIFSGGGKPTTSYQDINIYKCQ